MCVSKIILWPNRMAHASKIKPSVWAVFYWLMLLIPADYPLVVMLPLLKGHEKNCVFWCMEYGNGAINSWAQVKKCRQPKSVILFMVLRNKFDAIATR